MKKCPQCQAQMQEGYILKVTTYGNPKVEYGTAKPGRIQVAVCPQCGEISLSLAPERK